MKAAVGSALALAFALAATPGCGARDGRRSKDPAAGKAGAAPSPGVRNGHVAFWDRQLDGLVAFGGATEGAVVGTTSVWTRADGWRPLAGPEPGPRTFAAAATDTDSGRSFLYGGSRVLFGTTPTADWALSDFWVFDGQWTELARTGAPGPRIESSMAYDPRSQRLVLFGGYRISPSGEYEFLGDTWVWNGAAWRELELEHDGGLPAQGGTAMEYSPERGTVVLWARSADKQRGQLWELAETQWRRLGPPLPPRYLAVLKQSPAVGGLVLFGGWDGAARVDSTSVFRSGGWTKLDSMQRPRGRNHAAAAVDPRGRVLVHGGHDGTSVFGDLWSLDSTGWRQLVRQASRPRLDNGH